MRKKKTQTSHPDIEIYIGSHFVARVRNGKLSTRKKPDMSKVKPSKKQLEKRALFAKAVEFARSITRDPKKKARYPVKKGKSVFYTALRDYIKQHSRGIHRRGST